MISRLFRFPYGGEKCGECVGKNITYRRESIPYCGEKCGEFPQDVWKNVWKNPLI
jgi:hypothetical protein